MNRYVIAAITVLVAGCHSSTPPAQAGYKVYIDPQTGRPGTPPSSASTMAQAAVRTFPAAAATAAPTYIVHPDGTLELDVRPMQQLRVVEGADGAVQVRESTRMERGR